MQIYKEKQKLGALGVIRETIKTHGFFGMNQLSLGLYRGYSALLFFSIPKNYVRFGTFHFVKDNILTVRSDELRLNPNLTLSCVGFQLEPWKRFVWLRSRKRLKLS